ncbi:hypothetical protein [Vibrio phage J14]|nr:hypothetical protein [Vibrio phage J14]
MEYSDKLSSRETALGDAKIQTLENNWGSGVPVRCCSANARNSGFTREP